MILVDDPDNLELGLHAHWKGEGKNGQKEYNVQSFTLEEGGNVVEGESVVYVTWTDMTTG